MQAKDQCRMHVWLQVGQLPGPWLWTVCVEVSEKLFIGPLKPSGGFICKSIKVPQNKSVMECNDGDGYLRIVVAEDMW